MNPYSTVSLLLNIITSTLVLCLVNRDTKQLYDEYYVYHQSKTKAEWVTFSDMTNYAKFHLCVDVLQKLTKVNLMNGLYTTTDPNADLPVFETKTLKIINEYAYEPVLGNFTRCPLHLIMFQKNFYHIGLEFYIAVSHNDFCVYVFMSDYSSSFTSPNPDVYIAAEVCGLFADIRYDILELETEIQTWLEVDMLKKFQWPELATMSDDIRFTMCLDVFEKITRFHLYGRPHKCATSDGKLPNFASSMDYLYLHSDGANRTYIPLNVLSCPLNLIQYYKTKVTTEVYNHHEQFSLSNSINEGCVYKITSSTTDAPSYEIQVEICGIFFPVRTDWIGMEHDIAMNFNVPESPFQGVTSLWPGIERLRPADREKLCKNVFKKVYRKSPKNWPSRFICDVYEERLYFRRMNSSFAEMNTVFCPAHLLDAEIKPFSLIDSLNIGCVYRLTDRSHVYKRGRGQLVIQDEICGVLPVPSLLRIDSKRLTRPLKI